MARFSKSIASKYAMNGAAQVARDLTENHGRKISSGYVKSLTDVIGSIAQEKEASWEYAIPELPHDVAAIGVSMDGTCMLTCETGWREAMAGCFSLYDSQGERMHTIYIGATPEYGKKTFKDRFEYELDQLKESYPLVKIIGVADGAVENWKYLTPKTDRQILDFWHVSEYIGAVATVLFRKKSETKKRREWLESRLHKLKHDADGASQLLAYLKTKRKVLVKKEDLKTLVTAITYVKNNLQRMDYAFHEKNNLPIGSGVCEAACKTLIKQRLCKSGMRWKEQGASSIISLRALQQTASRWNQFWEKIVQHGL